MPDDVGDGLIDGQDNLAYGQVVESCLAGVALNELPARGKLLRVALNLEMAHLQPSGRGWSLWSGAGGAWWVGVGHNNFAATRVRSSCRGASFMKVLTRRTSSSI